MNKRTKTNGKATKRQIEGHPALYTFVNVPRDPDHEKKVVENILAKAEHHQAGVIRE